MVGMTSFDMRWNYDMRSFLATRCSDKFLKAWVEGCPNDYKNFVSLMLVDDMNFCIILARLNRLNLLAEDYRINFYKKALGVATADGTSVFLDARVRDLMTPEEYEGALKEIEKEFLDYLDGLIDSLAENYDDPEEDPDDHFSEFRNNMLSLQEFYDKPEIIEAINEAEGKIDEAIYDIKRDNERRKEMEERKRASEFMDDDAFNALVSESETGHRESSTAPVPNKVLNLGIANPGSPRDIFDDVDE